MKVVQLDRNDLYLVLAMAYRSMAVTPTVIELGVLRGDNALAMYRALSPSFMVLVDAWSSEAAIKGYCPFDELPAWVNPVDAYDYYFGGSVREQRTYDAIYAECASKFGGMSNVAMLRYPTIEALPHIKPETGIDRFDLVYVDANHQYEHILRDLMRYQEIVAENGCMMLNDCCHSSAGTLQNLGVLEAVTSFLKRSNFRPVALTNSDWSDLILVRNGAMIGRVLDFLLANSDISYVDIPDQLLPAARVVDGEKRKNLSFA